MDELVVSLAEIMLLTELVFTVVLLAELVFTVVFTVVLLADISEKQKMRKKKVSEGFNTISVNWLYLLNACSDRLANGSMDICIKWYVINISGSVFFHGGILTWVVVINI